MFFGVPGWAEDYYNTPQLQYNVNASVAGGKGIANYLFAIGTATNEGMADNTDYSKYNIDFYLNMMPVKRLDGKYDPASHESITFAEQYVKGSLCGDGIFPVLVYAVASDNRRCCHL